MCQLLVCEAVFKAPCRQAEAWMSASLWCAGQCIQRSSIVLRAPLTTNQSNRSPGRLSLPDKEALSHILFFFIYTLWAKNGEHEWKFNRTDTTHAGRQTHTHTHIHTVSKRHFRSICDWQSVFVSFFGHFQGGREKLQGRFLEFGSTENPSQCCF